jgi:hypothetical protein
MTPTTVNMRVEPEATARIVELGLQAEVDRMIEHAVKTVPGICRVEIRLEDASDAHDEPYLSASAFREFALWSERNPEVDQFRDWKLENFSPDVLWRFNLHIWPDSPHAG